MPGPPLPAEYFDDLPVELYMAKFNQVTAELGDMDRRAVLVKLKENLAEDFGKYIDDKEKERVSQDSSKRRCDDHTAANHVLDIKKLAALEHNPNVEIPWTSSMTKYEPICNLHKQLDEATSRKVRKGVRMCRVIAPSRGYTEVHTLYGRHTGTMRVFEEGKRMNPSECFIDVKSIIAMAIHDIERKQKFEKDDCPEVSRPEGMSYLACQFDYHGEKTPWSGKITNNFYGEQFSPEMIAKVFQSDMFLTLVNNSAKNTLTGEWIYPSHASLIIGLSKGDFPYVPKLTYDKENDVFIIDFYDSQPNAWQAKQQLTVFKNLMKPLLEEAYELHFDKKFNAEGRIKCGYVRGFGYQKTDYDCAAFVIAIHERLTRGAVINQLTVNNDLMPNVRRAACEVLLKGGYTEEKPTLEDYYYLWNDKNNNVLP